MARTCEICGKSPQSGNTVSHSNNKRRTRNLPNLRRLRIVQKGTVKRVKICARCVRTGNFQLA